MPLKFILIILLMGVAHSSTEEPNKKSLWQRFKDFFSPIETVEGEGPLYDKIRALDSEISQKEGKYARERRPQNKQRIKKEIDDLKAEREKIAVEIEAQQKVAAQISSSSVAVSSSSILVESSSATPVPCTPEIQIIHDTITIRDTLIVHDTLYVIVTDKKEPEVEKDSLQ